MGNLDMRSAAKRRKNAAHGSSRVGEVRFEASPSGAKDQLSCMDFPRATGDASSYNTGGFDATNSANRLSFRNVANSSSLYTLLKSLYPSSSAFFKYSSDRSE